MSEQSETKFRKGVQRDLDSLSKHSIDFTIQQKTIRGDADKILCIRGLFIWLELKKLTGKSGALQVYKRERVKQAGGIAFEAKPNNWELIFEFLNKLDGGIFDHNSLQRLGGCWVPAHDSQTSTDANAQPSCVRDQGPGQADRRGAAEVSGAGKGTIPGVQRNWKGSGAQ